MTATKSKRSVETGDDVWVAIAWHYNDWEEDPPGNFDISDKENVSEVVITACSREDLVRTAIEAYFQDHEVMEGGHGPIKSLSYYKVSFNQHGTGQYVATYDSCDGWSDVIDKPKGSK